MADWTWARLDFIFLATEASLVEVLNQVLVHFLLAFLIHFTVDHRSYIISPQDEQNVNAVDVHT